MEKQREVEHVRKKRRTRGSAGLSFSRNDPPAKVSFLPGSALHKYIQHDIDGQKGMTGNGSESTRERGDRQR